MKVVGTVLTLLGLGLIVWAVLFNATVETPSSMAGGAYQLPQSVYNLGALQMQDMIFNGGLAAFLAGCVLCAVGEMCECLIRAVKPEAFPPAD